MDTYSISPKFIFVVFNNEQLWQTVWVLIKCQWKALFNWWGIPLKHDNCACRVLRLTCNTGSLKVTNVNNYLIPKPIYIHIIITKHSFPGQLSHTHLSRLMLWAANASLVASQQLFHPTLTLSADAKDKHLWHFSLTNYLYMYARMHNTPYTPIPTCMHCFATPTVWEQSSLMCPRLLMTSVPVIHKVTNSYFLCIVCGMGLYNMRNDKKQQQTLCTTAQLIKRELQYYS